MYVNSIFMTLLSLTLFCYIVLTVLIDLLFLNDDLERPLKAILVLEISPAYYGKLNGIYWNGAVSEMSILAQRPIKVTRCHTSGKTNSPETIQKCVYYYYYYYYNIVNHKKFYLIFMSWA